MHCVKLKMTHYTSVIMTRQYQWLQNLGVIAKFRCTCCYYMYTIWVACLPNEHIVGNVLANTDFCLLTNDILLNGTAYVNACQEISWSLYRMCDKSSITTNTFAVAMTLLHSTLFIQPFQLSIILTGTYDTFGICFGVDTWTHWKFHSGNADITFELL